MTNWLLGLPSRFWKWLAAGVGGLALLAAVYFVGRRDRNGQVNLDIAKKELDVAIRQHQAAQKQVDELHARQVDIVADILTEETARLAQQKKTGEMSDAEIDKRLHDDGLLK